MTSRPLSPAAHTFFLLLDGVSCSFACTPPAPTHRSSSARIPLHATTSCGFRVAPNPESRLPLPPKPRIPVPLHVNNRESDIVSPDPRYPRRSAPPPPAPPTAETLASP